MTASLQQEAPRDGTQPILLDLSEPGNYENMVRMAAVIAQHLCAMPLEQLAHMADEAVQMALVKNVPAQALAQLRLDRAMFRALLIAQREVYHARERASV